MIPFQLHRRIPLIRRPFYQRDQLRAERDSLAAELTSLKATRSRDLKRVYSDHIDRQLSANNRDLALQDSVGGLFDHIGQIEVGIVRHYGLRHNGFLIDVGCGSGRLAKPLSVEHLGRYSGFDIVDALVDYARQITNRPDWRFEAIDHIGIPEPDKCADMVCFFSVLTHLLHEQSYWYLEEARRVLRPGGTIIVSFHEFADDRQWRVFAATLSRTKESSGDPMNVFIERNIFNAWAQHLGLTVKEFRDAEDSVTPAGPLGQSLCVLTTPE